MDVIEFLKQGQMWLIPLSCLVFTQIIKIFIRLSKGQKVHWRMFFSYGAMPSSHAALFVSLALIIFLVTGYNSAAFAVAIVVTIIFIRDAVGLRMVISKEGRMLNQVYHYYYMANHQNNHKIKDEKAPERVGHTPREVLVGSIVGIIYTGVLYLILLYI